MVLSWKLSWSASSHFPVQETEFADLAVEHRWLTAQEYQSESQRVRQGCCVLLAEELAGLVVSLRTFLGCACCQMSSFLSHHWRSLMCVWGLTLESLRLRWPGTSCYAGRKRNNILSVCKCWHQLERFRSSFIVNFLRMLEQHHRPPVSLSF